MLYFQFEGVAEAGLTSNDWRLFKEFMRGEGDADRYMKDLARPGALTAALNWYRANVRPLHARHLERSRFRADRRSHAQVVRAGHRAVALREDRRRRALDDARETGRAESSTARVPEPRTKNQQPRTRTQNPEP